MLSPTSPRERAFNSKSRDSMGPGLARQPRLGVLMFLKLPVVLNIGRILNLPLRPLLQSRLLLLIRLLVLLPMLLMLADRLRISDFHL